MKTSRFPIIFALVALIIAAMSYVHTLDIPDQFNATAGSNNAVEDSLSKTLQTHVLRVGVGGWSPYTILDPNTNEWSGFSIDLIKEVAARADPKIKVEFVKFNWDTIKADLQSGKFDMIAEPVFLTVPRAEIFGFSEPYSYFGVAVAVVRKDDNRFVNYSDLDKPGIVIAVAEGWTSTDYARKTLTKATLKPILLTNNNFAQLDEVLNGRADAALQDVPTVLQYVKAHPDQVKALWINNPPTTVAGAFVTRPDDFRLLNFLNASLESMIADGTLKQLDKKWATLGMLPTRPTELGSGLPQADNK